MTIRVDTMRRIDHLAGVPLCALLSPFVILFDWLRRQFGNQSSSPRKVLFIELSEMGSAILVDPAMRETIKRGAEVYFLIFKSNRISLELLNTVPNQRILTIDASGLLPLLFSTLNVLVKIHRLKIDTVIDLELFSRFTALLTGCSLAKRRVGYHIYHGEGLWRGEMLTHAVHYNPHIHISKNFMSLVHAAFSLQQEVPFSKTLIKDEDIVLAQAQVSDDQRDLVRDKVLQSLQDSTLSDEQKNSFPNPLILINPNASDLLPQRRWALASFSDLISQASKKWPSAVFLITGSPEERQYAQKVLEGSSSTNVINFAGQVKFTELPALYQLADIMVTNDSGPGHFSSITPLATIVLFGPETPALYGSLGNSIPIFAGLACSPCVSAGNHRKTPCTDNVCMQAIKVPQVLHAMERLLNSPSNEVVINFE
jgi:ADP-heptose:LPS heptosyltransferase